MKFSEKYGITRQSEDDWYDTFLPADTKLFIDPFLIWEESEGFWEPAHSHLIDFFEVVFDLIKQSAGDENSIYWKQASALLMFPEPPEFCSGVAEGSPLGSGSSTGLQREMLDGIRIAVGLGMSRIAHMETISLFQGGMGVDRIGDCVCNVLKSFFVRYTQEVCAKYDVPVERVSLLNAAWSSEFCRWQTKTVELPANTITYLRKGVLRSKKIAILLTPERFLREIPVAESNGFWNWSWQNLGRDIRGDFNFDVARNVSRRAKASMARQNPDAVALYLKHLEEVEKKPYPLAEDPHSLVNWYSDGAKYVPERNVAFVPRGPEEFQRFVNSLVGAYQHGIEHSDAWVLLWGDSGPRAERVAQALFRSIAIHYCRAKGIEMTSESNAGRGPVDFKFSGWSGRALVEMKLVKSSKIWDGILAQLPEYQIAEGVSVSMYVALAFTDEDYSDSFKKKLEKAAELASEHYGIDVKAILVDARKKDSASKLKNPELSDKLHRPADVESVES